MDIVGVSWKINGIFLLFIFLSKFPIWVECRSVKSRTGDREELFFQKNENHCPKRNAILKRAQKRHRLGKQLVSLPRPIDIRWSSNALTVERIAILFPSIIEALEELEAIPDIQIQAQSLLHHLRSKKFIFILNTLSKILDAAECCTKALQSHCLALDNVFGFINGLRDLLIMYRSEEYF